MENNTFGLFNDWKKRLIDNPFYKGIYDYGGNLQEKHGGEGLLDFGSAVSRDALDTAGGVIDTTADYTLGRDRRVNPPSDPNAIVERPGFTKSKFYKDIKNIPLDVRHRVPKPDPTVTPFHPSQGGDTITNVPQDPKWWEKLANMAGVDPIKAAASWKDKGGFEGLMANPAFTMGLAFMQAGAEGKSLGQGALDNVMKAAGISSHYKKILKDRKEEPIQATSGDIAEVKSLLKGLNIDEGNIWEKAWGRVVKGEHPELEFDAAAEEIAVQLQKEIRDWQANNLDAKGNPKIIRQTDKIDILKKLIKDKKLEKRESILSKLGITAGTIRKPVNFAQGGQIQAGQHAIVGEGGPEYFLPQESGKILSNDDSRIFSMLLSANPQLQNVSRTRAEKILRNRFPEYFE